MSADLIDQLAAAIARHTARRIPLAVDLWGVAEIAAYLKCSNQYVRDNYLSRPVPAKIPASIPSTEGSMAYIRRRGKAPHGCGRGFLLPGRVAAGTEPAGAHAGHRKEAPRGVSGLRRRMATCGRNPGNGMRLRAIRSEW